MFGVIPAAGAGSRIQPLAFSKELLPVGSRIDGGVEHPRAVSEYLVERLVAGGATRLCFVISPGKSDILSYYGGAVHQVPICYAVQPRPAGLCDAIFQAAPFIDPDQPVAVGLPDTVWFPVDALRALPDDRLSFLLFRVDRPHLFDAVVTGQRDQVEEIQVKNEAPRTPWVWGAFKMPGRTLLELRDLWRDRDRRDEYFGTLVNQYLSQGGTALGVRAGASYVDVGTLHGYREALRLLGGAQEAVGGK